MTAEDTRTAVDELGVAFLFAPQYHAGVRHAAGADACSSTMKTRTIFNILGPLINLLAPISS